jgi:hypothetical protein
MLMATQMLSILPRTNIWAFTLCILLIFSSGIADARVGTITKQAGVSGEIVRAKTKLEANKGAGIEMNDTITTGKTRLGLTFEDATEVAITEQSRLVVDDFVYDPKARTGKLSMKVALGTVRYASGAIAHNSRENVRIQSPTATISVRGTDFTMTIDEIGRSLVILLPTCPDPKKPDECWTGEIEVASDVGSVILNQAFQATVVASSDRAPSAPKLIGVLEMNIDNLLIVSPPREFPGGMGHIDQAQNTGFLDDDLLQFEELTRELLAEDQLVYKELEVNRLNIDYLDNLLDITNMLRSDEFGDDPVLPTIHNYRTWVQSSYNEEQIFLHSERPPHIAVVTLERYSEGNINIIQDGISALLQINDGGTNVVINITQTQ